MNATPALTRVVKRLELERDFSSTKSEICFMDGYRDQGNHWKSIATGIEQSIALVKEAMDKANKEEGTKEAPCWNKL